MTAVSMNGATAETATDNDLYGAYDWKITFYIDGNPHGGAEGRTGRKAKSKERITEELRGLPPGVVGRGEIVRVSLVDPDFQRHVASAERDRDGVIAWTEH